MRSLIAALLLAAALSAGAECVSPWFPLRGNAVLVYRQKSTLLLNGAELMTTTLELRREQFTAGREIHYVETTTKEDSAPEREEQTLRCTDIGVVQRVTGFTFNGTQYGSKLTPGATWTWGWQGTGIGATYQYTVREREKVKVPAGTFDAIRIDYRGVATSETRGKLPTITGTLWFADGIGLIKQAEDDPALGLTPDKSVMELIFVSGAK